MKKFINNIILVVLRNKVKTIIISFFFIAVIGGLVTYLVLDNDTTDKTNKCVLKFDTSGGSDIKEFAFKCGSLVKNPNLIPEKNGFEFDHWEYNGKEFKFNSKLKNSVVLKAIYKPLDDTEIITINFDTMGGSKIESYEIKKGDLVLKPKNPTKKGYKFNGWYLDYKPFDFSKPVETNITLKAKWDEKSDKADTIPTVSSSSKYKCAGKFRSDIPEANVKLGYKDHVNWTWSTYGVRVTDTVDPCYETYKSSDESIATVNSKGIITTKNIGIVYISECFNDTETKKEVVCFKGKLIVEPMEPIPDNDEIWLINCRVDNYTMEIGEKQKIRLEISPSKYKPTTFTWSSDKDGVVKFLDNNGNIEAIGEGEIWISVKSANGTVGACPVKVIPKQVHITSFSLNKSSLNLTRGDKYDLVPNISPDNATNKRIWWSSSNPNVAWVDNGKVVASGNGDAVITATTDDGNKVATCNVFVRDIYVSNVNLSATDIDLIKGETFKLSATVLPNNATNKHVSWSSSNNDVAKVTSSGKITAINDGTATITVSSDDGHASSTCTVRVRSIHVDSISLNKTSTDLYKGNHITLSPTISPSNATNKAVSWSSSNSDVASVDSNGKVTGNSTGTATITATTEDGNKTATCEVRVINQPLTATSSLGITTKFSGNNIERGVEVNITASGGSGTYNYYKIRLYKNGTLVHQVLNKNMFAVGHTNGEYYVEYEVHDTDGAEYSGVSGTTTISGF